jgi:drug/metabolite transporter (DMT)-like permease
MSVPGAYLGIILIWSTTSLAIQWSTQGAGFAFAVFARMLVGATLTYWGARHIHSGLISVLFGLTPLMTSVLAALWLREKALTVLRVIGMVLGVGGLAIIFAHGESAGDAQAGAGLAALVLAVFFYSASLVWPKRIDDDSHALATTAGKLVVSLPLFGLVWWFTEGSVPVDLPVRTEAAIAYLGVFGSVLGFALYYYVIRHLEAGRVALITLVTPVLALLLG